MLAEGSEVWNLESEGCMTFMAVSARQNRIMIVLSENCSFQPLRFSLMWRSGTLSSPGHRWFASSAEAEVHAGASARSRAAIVRPGRASENWSVRILIAYSISASCTCHTASLMRKWAWFEVNVGVVKKSHALHVLLSFGPSNLIHVPTPMIGNSNFVLIFSLSVLVYSLASNNNNYCSA